MVKIHLLQLRQNQNRPILAQISGVHGSDILLVQLAADEPLPELRWKAAIAARVIHLQAPRSQAAWRCWSTASAAPLLRRPLCTAGSSRAIKMPMIVMTTKSSTRRVKPARERAGGWGLGVRGSGKVEVVGSHRARPSEPIDRRRIPYFSGTSLSTPSISVPSFLTLKVRCPFPAPAPLFSSPSSPSRLSPLASSTAP